MERIGRGSAAVVAALVLIVAIAGPPAAAETTGSGEPFEVEGVEISGWWWLRDPDGVQDAAWRFATLPDGDEILMDLELLATDTTSGGSGVDAAVWLLVGPVVDGEALDPITAPVLLVLPNVSPPEDPVGYTTRGTYGFPIAALTLAIGDDGSQPSAAPGSMGLWVTLGRLGPDGTVLPDHIAVRETSIRLRSGPG